MTTASSSQRFGTRREATLALLLATLTAACWAALWAWSASPYARYLDHPGWGDASSLGALCTSIVVPTTVHALAWVLMIAAMMLPTTWPLLAMFRKVTASRPERDRLVAWVVAGFFLVWLVFGTLAHAADLALRAFAQRSGWLALNGWIVGALVLAGAGAFQFSALKYRCLDACHAPFGFVASRWHGISPERDAFRIGVDHGVFCVGCCWALMLVMFVVGLGSIGWMLALAAVMAAEKNLPWGRRLRTPLGIGLLAWSGALVVANT
jgi:predicted metal-binding membrane protein